MSWFNPGDIWQRMILECVFRRSVSAAIWHNIIPSFYYKKRISEYGSVGQVVINYHLLSSKFGNFEQLATGKNLLILVQA
jgi:hypothetical protein